MKKDYEKFILENYNMTIDGTKALNTNVADLLCYELTYKAMNNYLKKEDLRLPGLYYTREQFFWIASAQRYCHVSKNEETLQKIVLSKYPIEPFRANVPLHTNDNFLEDFNCKRKW